MNEKALIGISRRNARRFRQAQSAPVPAQGRRINVYTCEKCGGRTVTMHIHEGVTPFMLGCRASGKEGDCDGAAMSAFYRVSPLLKPEWEWFKPVGSEYNKLNDAMKEHVDKGGLDLRKRRP